MFIRDQSVDTLAPEFAAAFFSDIMPELDPFALSDRIGAYCAI